MARYHGTTWKYMRSLKLFRTIRRLHGNTGIMRSTTSAGDARGSQARPPPFRIKAAYYRKQAADARAQKAAKGHLSVEDASDLYDSSLRLNASGAPFKTQCKLWTSVREEETPAMVTRKLYTGAVPILRTLRQFHGGEEVALRPGPGDLVCPGWCRDASDLYDSVLQTAWHRLRMLQQFHDGEEVALPPGPGDLACPGWCRCGFPCAIVWGHENMPCMCYYYPRCLRRPLPRPVATIAVCSRRRRISGG